MANGDNQLSECCHLGVGGGFDEVNLLGQLGLEEEADG